MIKVKNSQLDNETIQTLNELIESEIKASAAFKLTRIMKDLNDIVKEKVQGELRIVQKYSQKNEEGKILEPIDEDGNPIKGAFKVEEGKMEDFNQEMSDLMQVENELNHNKIPFDDLGIDKISPKKIFKIDFIFEA